MYPVHLRSPAYSVFDGLKGNLKRSAFAASYDFGVAKLLASTVRNQYLSAARQVTQVGVIVPISPAASVRANYTRASESGALNETDFENARGDDCTRWHPADA